MTSLAESDTHDAPAAPPGGGRHLTLALFVIAGAQLMLTLDELIVNTALPHVQRALHFSGTSLEWIVTGYAVTFGGLLILGGRTGDILGRRRMFVGGLLLFSLSSLLGGLATHEWWLLAARALQGVGAAFAAPAALSLIAVTFLEGAQRNRALGVYAAMTGVGGAAGLVAGGLLTTYASWRWVFFVNVPLGLLIALGAVYAIPETRRHARRLDLPGAILGSGGFAALVYGLSHAATGPDGVSHWGDAATLLTLGGAVVALSAFVAVEARAEQPLLPLRIFANRNRAGVYLVLLCLASAFFGMFFFVTLFLQTVWGYSALKAGAAYLPFIGAFLVVSGITTQLVTRLGARPLLTAGAPLAAGGMFWLSRVGVGSDYVSGVMLPFVVFAAGAGLIFVPLTMTLVAGISEADSGVASSMFNAGQQIGGSIGLATIGTVAWTAFNTHVRHAAAGAREAVRPCSPIYDHALALGVTRALSIGAGAAVAALAITLLTIRVRREELPDGMVVL